MGLGLRSKTSGPMYVLQPAVHDQKSTTTLSFGILYQGSNSEDKKTSSDCLLIQRFIITDPFENGQVESPK